MTVYIISLYTMSISCYGYHCIDIHVSTYLIPQQGLAAMSQSDCSVTSVDKGTWRNRRCTFRISTRPSALGKSTCF